MKKVFKKQYEQLEEGSDIFVREISIRENEVLQDIQATHGNEASTQHLMYIVCVDKDCRQYFKEIDGVKELGLSHVKKITEKWLAMCGLKDVPVDAKKNDAKDDSAVLPTG